LALVGCGHRVDSVKPRQNTHVEANWRAHVDISVHLSNTKELVDFPVLIRLTPSRVDYSRMASDGHDLRFTDASHVDVSYEIDRFDPKGTSYVWVRLPSVQPGRDTKLVLEYDNPSAPYVSVGETLAVWQNGFAGVYHLENLEDSSPNKNGASGGALEPADGKVAAARLFSAKGPPLTTPTNGFAMLGERTICAWANPDNIEPGTATIAGYGDFTLAREGGGLRCGSALAASAFKPNTWHHVCCVHAAGDNTLYIDGVPSTAKGHSAETLHATMAQIGGKWAGILDEIRFSSVARDHDWIAAEFESISRDVATFAPPEAR
jgi:hypothetical protein